MSWLENVNIDVVESDIFDVDVQGVTVTVKCSLLPYGNISRKLFTKGGDQFLRLIKENKISCLDLGSSISVDVRCLNNKFKFNYLIMTALWNEESEYTSNLVYMFYVNSIRSALNVGMDSLALPLVKVEKNMLFSQLNKVITDLDELKNSETFTLERVFFCTTNKQSCDIARDHLQY